LRLIKGNVRNFPAGVTDHEEHVERSKGYGLNSEEVARPDGRCVLPQECRPVNEPPARENPETPVRILEARPRLPAHQQLLPRDTQAYVATVGFLVEGRKIVIWKASH
jgi:hypothetical protein